MNYIGLEQFPDNITLQRENHWIPMMRNSEVWTYEDVNIFLKPQNHGFTIYLTAGDQPVSRIVLRWRKQIGENVRILNDHWERGYGNLEWSSIMPDRVLPWYFLTSDGTLTHGYGVKTLPNAMCCWQVDANCITLVVDVRCGGCGVILAGRTLEAATVISRQGIPAEDGFHAAQEFCRMMCDKPLIPDFPIYGGNNWYYAYGKSSHEEIISDSKLISELAGNCKNRPFMVIDDGWHSDRYQWYQNEDDPWVDGTKDFPDMAKLATEMKEAGVRPGLWYRPLQTSRRLPEEWLLKTNRTFDKTMDALVLDPSIPEVLDTIAGYMKRFAGWGYELIKHDFTSYDLFGRWGFDYNLNLTNPGWHFADRSKTTAEIILALYRTIKMSAPELFIIGCNTLSHLSAGIFEINRTGDDTSGQQWERTRKMGINTLAMRMPHHNAFYVADADCVGLTKDVDWELNKRFLELLAGSGTAFFVSADPKAMGREQKDAVREAFSIASQVNPAAQPLDWMYNATPSKWLIRGEIREYDWVDYDKLENCSGGGYEEI